MSDAGAAAAHNVARPIPSAAQARIISAALELFARHGVARTSLQMIADSIGVTKAAVYHQFNAKDEIVIAAAEAELASVEAVIEAAEAEPTRALARNTLVVGIVDLAVVHRRPVSTLLSDPEIVQFFAEHEPFRQVMDRLCRVLMGDTIGHQERVSMAILTAAISGAVMHPLVADLDDETLRSQLKQLTQLIVPGMPFV